MSQQEPVKQADFVRSKSFLITPVKPAVDRKQGAKLNFKEGLQRGISLSHQNLGMKSANITTYFEIIFLGRSCSLSFGLVWFLQITCNIEFSTQLLRRYNLHVMKLIHFSVQFIKYKIEP